MVRWCREGGNRPFRGIDFSGCRAANPEIAYNRSILPPHMFGIWMNYWNAVCLVLACVIIGASLSAKRGNYWIAVLCFTVLVTGSAFMAVFPWMFGINMAQAFAPTPGGVLAYLPPLSVAACLACPAVFLYPPFSEKTGFRIVTAISGLVVVCSLGAFVLTALGDGLARDPYFAKQVVFQWLLWMRIHLLRRALRRIDG